MLVTSSHRCLSTVSFLFSWPIHCLHTHHTNYTGTWQGTWEDFFMIAYGIGKYEAFFFEKKCMLSRTHRTLTGVQPLVLRYWSGYQRNHDIRTTLSQRCTAECRVALRAVNLQKRQAFSVAAECDSCDLTFRGVVVLSCLENVVSVCCCKTGETCIWHERCSPTLGGSSLTRHCVAMAWFPHEPFDAVTCCIPSSRRSKLGNTGYKGPPHSRTAQNTPSLNHVNDQKWKLHLVSRWIPWTEVQLQENPWQESSILVDDLCGTGGNEREQRVLTRLRNYFQVGSEDWNDVAFIGLRIRWTQDSQNGPYIEVSQDKAIDELEIPVERSTKEDIHCTP